MEFAGFDTTELDAARAAYAAEAKARWGDSDAWRESQERAQHRTPAQWKELERESNEIFRAFAALRTGDPGGAAARQLVERWQAFLTEHYYRCTKEILAGLGQMYTDDRRFRENLDRFGPGTAAFISAAIARYCGN